MQRKGQAAMEFLMTYGWAILVVVAAIVALLYFDVLNPGKYAPDTCVMHDTQVGCIDHNGDADTVNMVLKNNVGEQITGVNVTLETDIGTILCTPNATTMAGDAEQTYSCSSGADSFSDRIDGTINVEYVKSSSGLTHTKTGDFGLQIS